MNKKVSVAIPCRNEVASISACVESILASDYPELDITVVDGMSDDGTREVLQELSEKYPNVKMVDNPEQLTPYAFNYGVKNSDGFYLQIVGSRNNLAKDYISKLVEVLENDIEISCVGGDYQHSFETSTSKYIAWAMECKFGVGGDNYRIKKKSCYVDTVGVPMYRRSIFNEIGYFDERLTRNQDDDFNYRVIQAGHKIFYVADAKVKYLVRGTYKKLYKQMSQYGYFKIFVNKKHKTVTTLRQVVPALFLLFLILGPLISLLFRPFFMVYFFVVFFYGALGFLSASGVTKQLNEIVKVQWAMFVMHVGYGHGYLKGILDFILLGKSPAGNMQKQTT